MILKKYLNNLDIYYYNKKNNHGNEKTSNVL